MTNSNTDDENRPAAAPPSAGGPAQPSGDTRRNRVVAWVLMAVMAGAIGGGTAVYLALRPQDAEPHSNRAPAAAAAPTVARPKRLYRCPMHPAITSDRPGTCAICGMNLVLDAEEPQNARTAPAAREDSGTTESGAVGLPVEGLAVVTIDPDRQQMIGLRSVAATRAQITTAWRTVGRVEVDPTRVRRINVKVEGFVERVFIDFVGKPVSKGQPLMTLYSPSLLAAQDEYLLALRTQRQLGDAGVMGASGVDLVTASRRKLELWDVPAAAIDRLAQTGVATKTLTLLSPIAGVVTAKNVVEGATLRPGDAPYEITDLRMVWVMADAYETDIARVRVGMKATLTLPAYPNRLFEGRVQFIDPLMAASSRTVKVHVHVANPKGELKPEMFGEIAFAGQSRTVVKIPTDAVIRTGTKDVVFVVLGAGKFAPRAVQLGARDGESVEVTGGLQEGDEVVTRANFLVDSESRLRASLAAMAGKNK